MIKIYLKADNLQDMQNQLPGLWSVGSNGDVLWSRQAEFCYIGQVAEAPAVVDQGEIVIAPVYKLGVYANAYTTDIKFAKFFVEKPCFIGYFCDVNGECVGNPPNIPFYSNQI